MDYLIVCRCGHTLDHHLGDGGCDRCNCPAGRAASLEAAIARVSATQPTPRPDYERTTPARKRS